jgi:hypothetical protein
VRASGEKRTRYALRHADAVQWCYLFTVQLGTPRGRYDEYSSKVFPSVKKPRFIVQERKEPI